MKIVIDDVPQKIDNSSGQGKSSTIPDDIKGWCWGGFFLGWIWGLSNHVYISLLSAIPIFGIIIQIILGFKGNEWAWRNKKWDSIEHFNKVQDKWSWGGAIVFLVFIVFLLIQITR